ncbi:MAG: hypothetical protein WDW38_002374 [Sanguina aurantia]
MLARSNYRPLSIIYTPSPPDVSSTSQSDPAQAEGERTSEADASASASEYQVPDAPTFSSLGVDQLFMAGLAGMGITAPAPIQHAAIPVVLSGANAAFQSYTGSGKTLAYLLPIMTQGVRRADDMMEKGIRNVPLQALVIAPSQELAMQIMRVAQSLMPPAGRKAVQQCIGGANAWRQQEALEANTPLIVVGTPGRVAEMIRYGVLKLHSCPVLVLDEADQLLAPHFAEDMAHITEHTGKRLPSSRQTVLVSATLMQTVLRERHRPISAPCLWQPPLRTTSCATCTRHDTLRRVIHARSVNKALVFMNFQSRLMDVQFKLKARSMEVSTLHGEMDKLQRQNVLNDFRRGRVRAMVVSDVVARGLDVADCDAVFHLELPSNAAHYAHRAGRTGRMGSPRRCREAHVAHGTFTLGAVSSSSRQDSKEKDAFEQRQAARQQTAFEQETGTVGGSNSVPRGTRRPLLVPPPPASQQSLDAAATAAAAAAAAAQSGSSRASSKAEDDESEPVGAEDSDSEDDDDDDMTDLRFPDEAQLRQIKIRRGMMQGRGGSSASERGAGSEGGGSSSREASRMLGDELAEMRAEKARAREDRAQNNRR